MKKTILKIVALSLVAVMMCSILVSCGKTLSGTYSAKLDMGIVGSETTYKFSGKKVTITTTSGAMGFEKTVAFEGTYKIEDDKITFTFEGEDAKSYNGSLPFEKTEEGIKIAGVEYKKQ